MGGQFRRGLCESQDCSRLTRCLGGLQMKHAPALQLCYRIAVSTVLLGFSSAQTPSPVRPPGSALHRQVMIAPLEKINGPKIGRAVNRRAELHEENGRKFVRFGNGIGEGAYWLVGSDFNEGEIEVDLRGKNIRGESFVGI